MQGLIHIAAHPLTALVELTALGTPGVARVHCQSRLASLRGDHAEGMQLIVTGETVQATLAIVGEPSGNMLDVGRAVRRNVARALEDRAGLRAGEINVQRQAVGETE